MHDLNHICPENGERRIDGFGVLCITLFGN